MKKYIHFLLMFALILGLFAPGVKADEASPYVIEPQFDYASDFKDGFASVRRGETRGFIDKSGRWLGLEIDTMSTFSEGVMPIYNEEGRCGYINSSGEMSIAMTTYDYCEDFSEGMAIVGVKVGEESGLPVYQYGFIDSTGKEVVKPQYDSVQPFKEGIGIICTGKYHFDSKCGYVNTKGEIIVPLSVSVSSIQPFSEGLGAAGSTYYDKTGKAVISFDRTDLTSFDQGLARIYTLQGMKLIDKTGKTLTKHLYEDIDYFFEGVALVVRNGKIGYIDMNGDEVIPAQYYGGYRFLNGKARVIVDKPMERHDTSTPITYALIDKSGKELGRFNLTKYANYREPYESDAELIAVSDAEGNVGFINRLGELVVPLQYDWAAYMPDGLAVVQQGDKFGIIDSTGKEVYKPQFKYIYMMETGFQEGLKAVRDYETGLWGYIAMPGVKQEVTEPLLADTADHSRGQAGAEDVPADPVIAHPSAAKIVVNGRQVSFQAYNIHNNNYFKLRDLAMALKGTEAGFEIVWDGEKNAISLKSGEDYTAVGGELTVSGHSAAEHALPSTAALYLDDKEVELTAYTIQGNNYFKLRDIASLIDFGVLWDEAASTIRIDTQTHYVHE